MTVDEWLSNMLLKNNHQLTGGYPDYYRTWRRDSDFADVIAELNC